MKYILIAGIVILLLLAAGAAFCYVFLKGLFLAFMSDSDGTHARPPDKPGAER